MSWSKEEFKHKLLEQEAFYHIHHPLHVAMNAGQLTPEQIRGWVANRFYYQLNIPQKDANIIANCPVVEVRRHWVERIRDHDGEREGEGGIEAWIQLGEACQIPRDELISCVHVVPAVRAAVDSYVSFARSHPWQEAVCSSLTELFAPAIHTQRLAGWPQLYPWIDQKGLAYFQSRIKLANRDVAHGLEIVLDHFTTQEQQTRAIAILHFKLGVLWAIADGIAAEYAHPYETSGFKSYFAPPSPRIAPHYRLQFEPTSNAHVLLYPEGLVELSDSAAAILKQCNGLLTAQEIVEVLKQEFDDPELEADIGEFLAEAYEQGWIKNA